MSKVTLFLCVSKTKAEKILGYAYMYVQMLYWVWDTTGNSLHTMMMRLA